VAIINIICGAKPRVVDRQAIHLHATSEAFLQGMAPTRTESRARRPYTEVSLIQNYGPWSLVREQMNVFIGFLVPTLWECKEIIIWIAFD
jgi:hypothetical protein